MRDPFDPRWARIGGWCVAVLIVTSWLGPNHARAQTVSPSAVPNAKQPSIAQLRARAETGDAVAQHQLALAYHAGAGVPKDDTQTVAWNLKSAQQGYLEAELNLAWLYQHGVGTARDDAASFQWFLKAARQGYAPAETIVGQSYDHGVGVARNPAEAFTWYKKAADQDDPTGEQLLAQLYLYGDPAFRDLKKGLTYALTAAGRSHLAASAVADCYWNGIFVTADKSYACAYALVARDLRPTEANARQLAQYQSGSTPQELERAQHLFAVLQDRFKGLNQSRAFSFNLGGRPSLKVPFRNVQSTLLVTACIDHHPPATFVLDTGASATCLDSRYASQLGLKSNDYKAYFALGLEPDLIRIGETGSLALGALTWKEPRLCITPLTLDEELGQPIAGIIGSDILSLLVVRIDYENSLIELIDPKFFHPDADLGEPVPLVFKSDSLPFVPASIVNGGVESKKETFLFDTGSVGEVDTNPGFWTDNPSLPFTPKKATGSTGFDGVVVHSGTGLCSAFLLGSTRLDSIMVGAHASPDGGNVNPNGGTIGNDVWRRFTVTLDYPGMRLFLQKNRHFGDAWHYPKAGVHVVAHAPDYKTFTVLQILPDSAGARAGFQPGDVILKLNDFDPPTLEQIHTAFWTAGDYQVQVQRQDQTVTLDLHCIDDMK